jgi:hypothetical protein
MSAPKQLPGLQVTVDQLSTWVQSWVHYDNLTSAHNRQSTNARKLRDEFEDKICGALVNTPNEKMIIQIHSGRLQIVEDKHVQPLTQGRLEEYLHEYFTQKTGSPVETETAAIMKFIREHRSTQVTKKLKRSANSTTNLPPLPAPPIAGAAGTPTQGRLPPK